MNKKSLKEMFEFFPNANWISQGKGNCNIVVHSSRVKPIVLNRLQWGFQTWQTQRGEFSEIDRKLCQIDWGNRKTWVTRCVSRKEVMG